VTARVERPDRAAAELDDDRVQELAVEVLEAEVVHVEQDERFRRDLGRDRARVTHLGDVADATEDPVRDSRRAA